MQFGRTSILALLLCQAALPTRAQAVDDLAGIWTTGPVNACPAHTYAWSIVGDNISFSDQAGHTDAERIIGRRANGFVTSTVSSSSAAAGTQWDYRITGQGSVEVHNLTTGKGFTLSRCPTAPPLSTALPGVSPSNSAGFDCTRASSPIERLICSDPTLANLDTELNRQWINAKGATQPGNQDALLQSQRNWLKQRQTSCNVTGLTLPNDPTVMNCLRAATQARSTELAQYVANIRAAKPLPDSPTRPTVFQKAPTIASNNSPIPNAVASCNGTENNIDKIVCGDLAIAAMVDTVKNKTEREVGITPPDRRMNLILDGQKWMKDHLESCNIDYNTTMYDDQSKECLRDLLLNRIKILNDRLIKHNPPLNADKSEELINSIKGEWTQGSASNCTNVYNVQVRNDLITTYDPVHHTVYNEQIFYAENKILQAVTRVTEGPSGSNFHWVHAGLLTRYQFITTNDIDVSVNNGAEHYHMTRCPTATPEGEAEMRRIALGVKTGEELTQIANQRTDIAAKSCLALSFPPGPLEGDVWGRYAAIAMTSRQVLQQSTDLRAESMLNSCNRAIRRAQADTEQFLKSAPSSLPLVWQESLISCRQQVELVCGNTLQSNDLSSPSPPAQNSCSWYRLIATCRGFDDYPRP